MLTIEQVQALKIAYDHAAAEVSRLSHLARAAERTDTQEAREYYEEAERMARTAEILKDLAINSTWTK